MQRRDFITVLGGAAVAWPFAARAQQLTTIPRIGIINDAPYWEPFRQGLRDLGYVEGRNIIIEYRSAEEKQDRLAIAAADLARIPVDVIVTYGTPATRAAKQATTTIPIVMMGIGDPLGSGLVASFARPGGNVTGNTILGPDIGGKRLQVLKSTIPSISRLACLFNPANASNVIYFDSLRAPARALGMTLFAVEVRATDEFDSAFAVMKKERPDAFIMTADPLHLLHAGWIIDFLAKNHVPAMYQVKENVVAGGLMSYGASLPAMLRRGASYVQKILQGTNPSDLPVEQPTKFELVINLMTAKALGLTIPQQMLLLADEVIE